MAGEVFLSVTCVIIILKQRIEIKPLGNLNTQCDNNWRSLYLFVFMRPVWDLHYSIASCPQQKKHIDFNTAKSLSHFHPCKQGNLKTQCGYRQMLLANCVSQLVAARWLMSRDCLAVREMDLDTSEGLERAAQRTAGNVLKKGLWQQFLDMHIPCRSLYHYWNRWIMAKSRNRCMSDLVINCKSPVLCEWQAFESR